MKTYEASTEIEARPSAVIELLTDPATCAEWSPVDFEVDDPSSRLEPGTQLAVGGRVAGQRVSFDLSVIDAGRRHLELTASGPFDVSARYEAREATAGTELTASVSVTGRGIRGRIVSSAAEALLAGGALEHALDRIARTATAAAAV
jgi:hypothetical protein